MTSKRICMGALAILAGIGAMYALLSMLTQGMLGGVSPAEVWWDRLYVWWIDFLAAGLLLMLAVLLWRKAYATTSLRPERGAKRRVLLFPLAHIFLTSALYFADLAAYLFEHGGGDSSSMPALYALVSVTSAVVALAIFWSLRARSNVGKKAMH